MLPYLPTFWSMKPVIEARESLRRSAEIALGTGSMKKGDASRLRRQWRRAAEGPRGFRPVRRPKSREEHHAVLASIGVTVVPARKD